MPDHRPVVLIATPAYAHRVHGVYFEDGRTYVHHNYYKKEWYIDSNSDASPIPASSGLVVSIEKIA